MSEEKQIIKEETKMGIILGRKGCDEKRGCKIEIFFNDNGKQLIVASQLGYDEAFKLFNQIKENFNDEQKTIEIKYDNDTFFIQKSNITFIAFKVNIYLEGER